jgi:hypothetical protein
MRVNSHCLVLLWVVIAATAICMGPTSSPYLWATPPADKYEDLVELNFAGGIASGTGVRDKGGFTVVTVAADKTRTKLSVSFAFKEEENRTASDFQIVAVDAGGKRHEAKAETRVSAGGKGIVVVTLVAEFSLVSDKIDALVIRQRTDK